METVLYADVLFLINFGMDFISLWLTVLISHRDSSAGRLFLAALAGGAYGVLSAVFITGRFVSLILSLAVSALMVRIACIGKLSPVNYARCSAILWGVGALIGGAVTAVCSAGNPRAESVGAHNAPFFALALGAAAASGCAKLIAKHRARKNVTVTVSLFGVKARADCLVDTGNSVREPISSRPVVFVKKSLFSRLPSRYTDPLITGAAALERLPPEIRSRVRLVNVASAGGAKLTPCIFPDSITVSLGKEERPVRAALVISDVKDFSGCDGIVPACLV